MHERTQSVAAGLALLTLGGCATIDRFPRVYGGTRRHVDRPLPITSGTGIVGVALALSGISHPLIKGPYIVSWLIDAPLSLVLDTALLPATSVAWLYDWVEDRAERQEREWWRADEDVHRWRAEQGPLVRAWQEDPAAAVQVLAEADRLEAERVALARDTLRRQEADVVVGPLRGALEALVGEADAQPEAARALLNCAAELGAEGAETAPVLEELLRRREPGADPLATHLVQVLLTQGWPGRRALGNTLYWRPSLRQHVLGVLLEEAPRDLDPLANRLVLCLGDANASVRRYAEQLLRRLGVRAVPALRGAENDPHPRMTPTLRRNARELLHALEP
ncbi:YceK/YidQ family lipoprotein [Planctomycetota bacterium]|nr:YceK/YidQ family lipoprotein [Planctomycetota bacterium]